MNDIVLRPLPQFSSGLADEWDSGTLKGMESLYSESSPQSVFKWEFEKAQNKGFFFDSPKGFIF